MLRVVRLPLPIFVAAGRQSLLRRGGQPRARPHSRHAVLADRSQTHQYQFAPPSARLSETYTYPRENSMSVLDQKKAHKIQQSRLRVALERSRLYRETV